MQCLMRSAIEDRIISGVLLTRQLGRWSVKSQPATVAGLFDAGYHTFDEQ